MDSLEAGIAELLSLTERDKPRLPKFSLENFCRSPVTGMMHEKQLAFVKDRSHRVHVMCARQSGKSQGDDAILMEAGLFAPYSTNTILGFNGPHIRSQNWEPIWKRMFDRFAGLDSDWRNESRMVTTFPNGARVIMSGTDDAKHIKNVLGGRIDNGVFIIDECFVAGTLVDGRPIETIVTGDLVAAIDHVTGAVVRRRVAQTLKRQSVDIMNVRSEAGAVTCTASHPFFVKDKGYVHAKNLREGDLLCVRHSMFGQADMLSVVPVDPANQAVDGEHVAHAGRQRADRGGQAVVQPDEQPGVQREDASHASADWSSAEREGRQRARSDTGGGHLGRGAGRTMEDRTSRADEGEEARGVWVPDLLQAGSGGRIDQDMYRGRWSEPFDAGAEGPGREEDGALKWARVEGVSRVEPGGTGGTTVYNLEVEGAHTYFANGVLVHNCQDQGVLDELLDSILPPMMGINARIILSGVFPEVPAGRFWRESGWVERNGQWVQEGSRGWSRHNWGRLANVHTPDAWAVLQRYLAETGLSMDDPQIVRDWTGRPAFDPEATAYRYLKSRNGYQPVTPEWLRMIYGAAKDGVAIDERGKEIKYAHEMRLDKNGARYGMMAAEPLDGVNVFGMALDPGSNSDRASIQAWGWGERFRGVQHVFDWTSERAARLSTGDMFAVLGLVYRALLRHGTGAGVCNPRYDAGSSQNTIDNLQGDYGIPLVLAAKKSDLIGQVNRNNDLLIDGRARIMAGSALEQDYTRARWDKAALERMQRVWARAWHPDSSEAGRYALQDFFESFKTEPDRPVEYGYREPFGQASPDGQGSVPYGPGNYGEGAAMPDRGHSGGGYGGGYQP